MDTEEIIKRLRQPAAKEHVSPSALAQNAKTPAPKNAPARRPFQDALLLGTALAVVVAAAITFFSVLGAKNRAENVSDEIDPTQIEGLVIQKEFNPNQEVTYVQISEGQDRNVAVSNLGTTLPIISRYNYKSLTLENFQIIGTAPWALNTNFAANLDDPSMIQYLLSNNEMIQAFLLRSDVSPLLDSPQELAALVGDLRAMKEFFEDETTQQILARPELVKIFSNSRFMSFLLISESAKYFRSHPQEAADLIASSPYLQQLQANAAVAQAVRENRYLNKIADVLLTPRAPAVMPQEQQTTGKSKKTSGKKQKKS